MPQPYKSESLTLDIQSNGSILFRTTKTETLDETMRSFSENTTPEFIAQQIADLAVEQAINARDADPMSTFEIRLNVRTIPEPVLEALKKILWERRETLERGFRLSLVNVHLLHGFGESAAPTIRPTI